MIPISDENPTYRTPVVTIGLLVALGVVWIFVQGAGFSNYALAVSVCNLGMVPGEITHRAPLGTAVPIGPGLLCVVDSEAINWLTPLTSMFLHGGWAHILGNGLYLWIFGNNVEDSMGRVRFLIFYLLCGIGAAAAQIAVSPGSPVPMVGASGAISGVLGAYLVLYPRVRVNVLLFFCFFVQIIAVPAYLVLLLWIGTQVLSGLPELGGIREVSSGVAVFAHIGGFVMGLLLVKLFENPELVARRLAYLRSMSQRRRPPFGWP
jgi:membrane associated rhomboid family serine protease